MNRAGELSTRGTIGDRLRWARRRRFVGRTSEVELFHSMLVREASHTVLFLHGPGGIGKTALLLACIEVADDLGVSAIRVDLEALGPSPPAFLAGLATALGLSEGASPLERMRGGGRWALLLDTYEASAPFDEWLRERFLPQLPDDVVVVLAGRNPPAPEWVADPGWRELVRVVSLRNLGPDDVRTYLMIEGLDTGLHDLMLEVTHGHPLALSLFADVIAQRAGSSAGHRMPQLADAPEVVRILLERFLEEVPGPQHRRALHVCAHARFTTESLLHHVLGDDGGPLFSWLRDLSFVEEGPSGLFPHELARDVLDADLRWRDGAGYAELHRRVRAHAVDRVQDAHGAEQQRACTDILFLHRTNPVISAFGDWTTLGQAYADAVGPDDHEPILAMAERHEGRVSAALVSHWLQHQPRAFGVVRAAGEVPIGFTVLLALHEASEEERVADPGASAMWAYALRHGPPAPGEAVMAMRFLVDAKAYQRPSPSFNLMCVQGVQHILTCSRLAWSFVGAFAQPDVVAPTFALLDYHRALDADYEVGGRHYGVFAHDFRRVPPDAWLELTARHDVEDVGPAPRPLGPTVALALSQPEFTDAVRAALRDLHRPDRLARNPLLRSRLVQDRTGDGAPVEVLSHVVVEAAESLRSHPRDEKLHRAVDRTYLRPAVTQERAAEVLDLPFSTYRRHLTRGVEQVVARLWDHELYGAPD